MNIFEKLRINKRNNDNEMEKNWTVADLVRAFEKEVPNFKIDRNKINRIENGSQPPDADILIAYSKIFNVSTDYLLHLTDIPFKNEDVPKLEELNISSDAINYLKEATDYECLVLDTLLKHGYFKDICYAIYSYMQTYYKEIHIQDKTLGNTQLQDNEKMEFAEYRATKHFSDVLVNKISKDKDIQKFNKYEHDLETISHTFKSPKFQETMKKACDEFDKFAKSGKGGFNEFIEYLEEKE